MKILFIGGGNMAAALIGGLLARGTAAGDLVAIDPSEAQRSALQNRFGIVTHESVALARGSLPQRAGAPDAGRALDSGGASRSEGSIQAGHPLSADVLVLAVKPQQMREACIALQGAVGAQLILSVAAGVRAVDLSSWLGGHRRIVRTMPNTPAMIGLGAIGLAALPGTDAADRQTAETIMKAVGETVWVDDEALLDAVTAVSGSGPAYVFRLIEAIAAGGRRLGLSDEQAMRLTIRTFVGASQLAAQSDEPPSVLRERVTSKGGTTAAALAVLNERDIDRLFADALGAACTRSEELGRESGGSR